MEEREAPLVDGVRVVSKPMVRVVHANPVAVGVVLSLSLLFVTGVAWFLLHDTESRRRAEAVLARPASMPSAHITPKREVLTRWGISFILPPSVRKIDNDSMPAFPFTPLHTYEVRDTPCRIGYGTVPSALSARDTYPESATRAPLARDTGPITHIERRMPVTDSILPDPESVNTEVEVPYRISEFALAYYPLYYRNDSGGATRNAWTLFSVDDSAIPHLCHIAFRDILTTLVITHPPHSLTRTDTGLLYIEHHAQLGAYLLFRAESDRMARAVVTLDTGLVFAPTLFEDALYFVRTNGTLGMVSLFDDATPQSLPLALHEEASIHAYLPTREHIHYLAGTWCMRDTTTCDLTYGIYDRTSGATNDIESGITSPDRTSFATLIRAHRESEEDIDHLPTRHLSLTLTNGTVSSGPTQFEGIETRLVPITLP